MLHWRIVNDICFSPFFRGFAIISAMNQDKGYRRKKIAQDLLSIILMLLGATLAFLPFGWLGYVFPVGSLSVVGLGAIIGMYFVFKRDLSNKGKPSVLAIVSCLCWVALTITLLLLVFAPGFYGFDLEILVNSMLAIVWSGLLGIIFTCIALLR